MLPARFHALRDRVLSATDRVFAEPVSLHPMEKGAVDATRSVTIIEAVLRMGRGQGTFVSGMKTDRSWRSKIQAQQGELHIDRVQHPGLMMRKNDRVRALSRIGEPWFEILGIDDRGETRLVLYLGEL